MASAGAVVNFEGCCAASPQPRIFAKGFRLLDFRKGSETRTRAAAPSERGDALGAVTVPEPSVIKAGRIPLNFSSLRGMETFSSLSTTVGGLPLGPGISTGQISSLKAPEEVAAWAFWMERMA